MTAPALRTSAYTLPVAEAIDKGFRTSLEQKIGGLICEAAQYRGQKMEMPDALVIAAFYIRDLSTDFPQLATTDIQPIVWNGVKKVYGEFYGINAGTLHDWTAAWVASPEGQAALAARQVAKAAAALPQRRTRTAEEDDRDLARACNDAYRRWLEGWQPNYDKGTIGEVMHRAGYTSVLDPLRDLGNFKRDYLNAHGYAGTLPEIYAAAKAAGKTELFTIS